MRSPGYNKKPQGGVALVVALLFLLVVTIISVTAANNSSIGLKMAANMNDTYASFQSSEAGVFGLLGLAGTSNDPFNGVDVVNPFAALDPNATHPLQDLPHDPNSVDVDVFIRAAATICPRSGQDSSAGLLDCDYYGVASEHDVKKIARTKVELGVVKTIIGSAAR